MVWRAIEDGKTPKLRYKINPYNTASLQWFLKPEALYKVVPLATGRTLGMTLRPWRAGGVVMVLGVVKGFGLLKIQIFATLGFLIYIMVAFAFKFGIN